MPPQLAFPRAIRYLIAVAEHNSFTRAAEALDVSQPTLSQQIKQLEESLDVQLLDRSGRVLRLTDAGEVYLQHARRAVTELDAGHRALHDLHDLSRGALRVGMTPITDYLAAPLLDHFSARHPGIALSTFEMPQTEIEAEVAGDRLDLGIAFTNMMSTATASAEIETHVLFTERLKLAVGKRHPLAGEQRPISAHVLEEEPLVLLNPDFTLRHYFDMFCLENGLTPRVAMQTNSLSIIVEMTRLGRLCTILPDTIASAQHGIHPVMLLPELPDHTVTLIGRKDAYKSPACRAFFDLAAFWSGAGDGADLASDG